MSGRDLFIAIFITFIWGINFSFIKMGLSSLNPFYWHHSDFSSVLFL